MRGVNFRMDVNVQDTNSSCILSIFSKRSPCMTNLNPHQTPHTNKNCYYTSQFREWNLENNILDGLAN